MYGQLQTDYYVARGGGRESWMPRFSYKGFQYVQLSGPNHTPLPAGVTVSVASVRQVRSSVASTGELDVSQPTLARIHRNTQWAVQSNLHGIITDTPVYEKNGWTGDAQLMASTASLLFDTQRLYRKMFQDMADAQTADGEVPLLSPSNRNYGYVGKPAFKPADCCGATPAWDAFWFVLPWESYQRYGDIRALERTYPLMKKYLDDWIPRWTGKDGDAYAYTLTSGLGDWLPPKGVPTINALVSTAFLARMAEIAAGTARALHDAPGAAKYDQLFDRVRSDFNARFLSAEGIYREKAEDGFVQTAQILPLAFHLVPDAQRAAVAERLADDITNRRGGPRVRRRHRRRVRPAGADGDGAPRRRVHRGDPDGRAELGLLDRHAEVHGARRELAGGYAIAEPPFLRRDRAVVLRGPCGVDAARAGLRARSASRRTCRPRGSTTWRRGTTASAGRFDRNGRRARTASTSA